MKKLITLSFISAILLTGCFGKAETTPATEDIDLKAEKFKSTYVEIDYGKMDLELCAAIEDADEMKDCREKVVMEIMRQAFEQNKSSLCKKLDEDSLQEECVSNLEEL